MSTALAKKTPAELSAYLQEQTDLFKAKGLNPAMVESHELIPIDGGRFKLVKREERLTVLDWDPNENSCMVNIGERPGAQRLKFERASRRGKYNDADRLIGSETCSVEVGEVVPFVSRD